MWLHYKTAKSIANLFYDIDKLCRYNLGRGLLTSERDYVSSMFTFFNFPFGILNKQCFFNSRKYNIKWYARVHGGAVERNTGTDAVIVFRYKNEIKICMLEAKWPRIFTQPNYTWDQIYKGKSLPHFLSQIDRQTRIDSSVVVFEMFLLENYFGREKKWFDEYGSSCILLENIIRYLKTFMSPNFVWNNTYLRDCLDFIIVRKGLAKTNIYDIIYQLLTCKLGDIIEIDSHQKHLEIKIKKSKSITLPVLDLFESEINEGFIADLINPIGLSNFLFMHIDEK